MDTCEARPGAQKPFGELPAGPGDEARGREMLFDGDGTHRGAIPYAFDVRPSGG